MGNNKEWFADWFDSPYYHILYQKRDMNEAEFFLRNLVKHFNPNPGSKIIDLACGKGRHSIFLNSLGFEVTGVDLSQQSIGSAKEFENEKLHFEVQDLRSLEMKEHFDIALNLFTSFGYFDCFDTNVLVLKQIYSILNPGGFLLIDFFNAKKMIANLVTQESKEIENIQFDIDKELVEGQIIKSIHFMDAGKAYFYQEKVQALELKDFDMFLNKAGFKIIQTFGNYALGAFDEENSERLIIIASRDHVG